MPKRDPLVRLRHMRDHARQAIEMAAGRTCDDTYSDAMLRYALTHLVEIVGEAASQVPRETMDLCPRIPWSEVIGMRHRLIHGYDQVDCRILWDTVTSNLPVLVEQLDAVISAADGQAPEASLPAPQ